MTSNVVNFKKKAPEKSALEGGKRRPTNEEYVESLMEQFCELPLPVAMGFAAAIFEWTNNVNKK